jgi:4-hydroxy-tetrahydrodipicolinate synthase
MSVGAQGVISVASNLLPKQLTKMVHSYIKGDHKAALKLHEKYYPLFKDLFLETNPVPVKAALAMKGLVKEEYRLPLVKMHLDNRRRLRRTLKSVGVIK